MPIDGTNTSRVSAFRVIMGSRLKQVSAAIITVLSLLILVIYLKRRSHSLAQAIRCPPQNLSNDPAKGLHKNGLLAPSKCCYATIGKALEELCVRDAENGGAELVPKEPKSGCSCIDYFYCKLIIVSAISSNHMAEATELIKSVQQHMANTRLIMYSLGLIDEEMALLDSYCNVEVRVFDFHKYPDLAYAKNNLRKFGWKPVIVKEVSDEYDVVLWLDASGRLTRSLDPNVFKHLQKTPTFLAGPWEGRYCLHSNDPIVSYTHDSTLRYLFPNKSHDLAALRKELVIWGHMQATVWLVWLHEEMKKKFLNNWVDCAFHEECMAPRDAVVDCNPLKRWFIGQYSPQGQYIGCHRYDQSALDMILYREFGVSSTKVICQDFVFDLIQIDRDSRTDELFHIFLAVVVVSMVIIIFVNWYFSRSSN